MLHINWKENWTRLFSVLEEDSLLPPFPAKFGRSKQENYNYSDATMDGKRGK